MRLQAELGRVLVDSVSSVHPHHPNPHESCCEQVSSAHRCSAQDGLFQSGIVQGGSIHRDAGGFQRTGEGCEQEDQVGAQDFNCKVVCNESRREIETGHQEQRSQERHNSQKRSSCQDGKDNEKRENLCFGN